MLWISKESEHSLKVREHQQAELEDTIMARGVRALLTSSFYLILCHKHNIYYLVVKTVKIGEILTHSMSALSAKRCFQGGCISPHPQIKSST